MAEVFTEEGSTGVEDSTEVLADSMAAVAWAAMDIENGVRAAVQVDRGVQWISCDCKSGSRATQHPKDPPPQ